MKYIFDTSALVKLFQVEKGSEIVEEIVNDPDNAFGCLQNFAI